MNRRSFLANLGLASAALLLRFRPEIRAEMQASSYDFVSVSMRQSEAAMRDVMRMFYATSPYVQLLKGGNFPANAGDIR